MLGGGVNQHMENSICFVIFLNESFPYIIMILFVSKNLRCRVQIEGILPYLFKGSATIFNGQGIS